MNFWRRREIVVVPQPRPETPSDLYTRILESGSFTQRSWGIAYGLGQHEDKHQALLFAKRLASDPEAAMRWAGATALARLHSDGFRDAERALWGMLQDPSSAVRTKLAEEIRWDDLPETARLKHALAKDACSEVRRFTASGLYMHLDPESRLILDGLTRDSDGEVRAEAIGSLRAIEKDPPDVRDYISLASDPSSVVRAEMAGWLCEAEEAFSLPHLLHLVDDSDALVRGRSIQTLSRFKEPRAIEAIHKATSDPDGWIRAISLEILGRLNVSGVMELLLAHVDDAVSEVRKVIAQQLESRITPELLPVLEKLSEDEQNSNTRRSALRSLEKIPGEEAELLITKMLRDPSQIIAKAAKKALVARAKKEAIAPETVFELRYGRDSSVATRLAFHGRSSVPLQAWEKFLSEVQRWDGRVAPRANNVETEVFQVS